MYCGKCGAPIRDGNSFCTVCGAPVEEAGTDVVPVNGTPDKESKTPDAKRVLDWSILTIVMAFFPIVNWVFVAISRRKVKAYLAAGGTPCTEVNTARVLNRLSLVVTILTTVAAVFLLIYLAIRLALKSVIVTAVRAVADLLIKLVGG